MRQGLDWYKREPRAFVDGVRLAKMTAKEIAVYTVVVDLIYCSGGVTPNDPKYIAGHFSDMGAAAVRTTILSLVAKGKLAVEGEYLTNERAKNEAKTKQNLSETRAFSGRLGGVSSGESRRQSIDINHLAEANASSKPKAEKRREEKKKEEPNGSSKKRRGSRITDEWVLPKSFGEHALEEGWPEAVIRIEADKFKDYWIAKAGQSGVKLDWLATWRNWLRNKRERDGLPTGNVTPLPQQETYADQAMRRLGMNSPPGDEGGGVASLDFHRQMIGGAA